MVQLPVKYERWTTVWSLAQRIVHDCEPFMNSSGNPWSYNWERVLGQAFWMKFSKSHESQKNAVNINVDRVILH